MNRNTIIAFVLLLGAVMFFTSPWYLENIAGVKPQDKNTPHQTTGSESVQKPASPNGSAFHSTDDKREQGIGSIGPISTVTLDQASAVTAETTWVETKKLICGISRVGARIVSLKTKDYRYHRRDPKTQKDVFGDSLIELIPSVNTFGGANLTVDGNDMDGTLFNASDTASRIIITTQGEEIVFTGTASDGSVINKKFKFETESYRIGFTIESNSLPGKQIQIGWKSGLLESELGTSKSAAQYAKITAHYFDGKEIEHLTLKKDGKEERTGSFKWLALTTKYFLVALIPDSSKDEDLSVTAFPHNFEIKGTKTELVNYSIELKRSAENREEKFWIYAGPSHINEIRSYGLGLEKVMFSGWKWFLWADRWFPMICEYLLIALTWIFGLVKDYGLAIILITIAVKVVTYPLTLSSMKSMNRMKLLQPKVTALKEKYKSNQTKMNQALMQMYKDEGVNPLDPGCLPMFLQMPLLIALYVVLQKAIELRGASTFFLPWIHDLSQPEVLFRLPFEIPFYGDNFALIPIIMAVVTFFQNKMTMKDPNQQVMVYFMPIFMFVLFNSFPAGLVMYWTFSSVLGILQQKLVDAQTKPLSVLPVPAKGKSVKGWKKQG